MSRKKGIIVSGYFNPIHKGHIEYFNNAKALADELFVIVNSDHQRALKGSKEFQQEAERFFIVSNILAICLKLTAVLSLMYIFVFADIVLSPMFVIIYLYISYS